MHPLTDLAIALDPAQLMAEVIGSEPDPWQSRVLRSPSKRLMLLCARQMGKSTTTSCMALHTALYQPNSLVLLVSPSQRQSSELYRKVVDAFNCLGRPMGTVEDSSTTLALENGSRIVSLPGSASTVRGFSAPKLVILDEAAQISDDLLAALTPMLATGGGRLCLLSTPYGQRGVYFDLWSQSGDDWERVKATALDCGRISAEFLEEQRRTLGERVYRQEFLCSFESTTDQCFATDVVLASFSSDAPPLFGVAS
jgi:hypothetical protein